MKQLNTLQKSESQLPDRKRWRLSMFMLFAVLLGTVNGYAQISNWSVAPVISPDNNLVAYGKSRTLSFAFKPDADMAKTGIKITVPEGVIFEKVENGAGNEAGVPETKTTTGKNWELSYNSLNQDKLVSLVVTLKAESLTADNGDITIEVFKDGSSTALVDNTIELNLYSPRISITSTGGAELDFKDNTSIAKEIALAVVATEGEASSFKVMLEVEAWTTLSNFKMNGATLRNAVGEPTSVSDDYNANRIYTLTIVSDDLTNGVLSSVVSSSQKLTFDAISTIHGDRPIKIDWQYPAVSEHTSSQTAQIITMRYPPVIGEPKLQPYDQYIMNAFNKKVLGSNWYDLTLDGDQLNYGHYFLVNAGTAAHELIFTATNMSYLGASEIEGVTYVIYENETMLNKLKEGPVEKVEVIGNRSTGSNYLHYKENFPYELKIYLPKEVTVPNKGIVEIVVPMKMGMIYDNMSSSKDQFINLNPLVYYSRHARSVYAVTMGGLAQTTGSNYSYLSGGFVPRMTASVTPAYIRPEGSQTTVINIIPESIDATLFTQEMFVRVPKWLKLKNDKVSYIKEDGNAWMSDIPVEARPELATAEYTVYSWKLNQTGGYSSQTSIELSFEGPSKSEYPSTHENVEGTVKYWTNFIVNGQRLEAITQRHQKVTLLCKESGIKLNSFTSQRLTVGRVDENKNGYADNTNDATDPRGDLYHLNDLGQLVWEATILDNDMNHLYLPMETSVTNLLRGTAGTFTVERDNIQLSVEREGTTLPVITITYEEVENNAARRFLTADFAFKKDDKLTITMPFKANNATGLYGHIETECFVSYASIDKADLFALPAPDTRRGFDKEAVSLWCISWHDNLIVLGSDTYQFTNEVAKNPFGTVGVHFNPLYNQQLAPGGFGKEARTDKIPYIETYSMTIPEGYDLKSLTIASSGMSATIPVGEASQSGNTYTFKLDDYWKDTEPAETNKLIKPGTNIDYSIQPLVAASKNASTEPVKVPITITLANTDAGKYPKKTISTSSPKFQFIGVTSELKTGTVSELPTSTEPRVLPVTFSNPNTGLTMEDNYLYVEGDINYVAGVSPVLVGTGQTTGTLKPVGGGAGFCWFELGNLPEGKSFTYNLQFSYTGPKDGNNILLYSSSKFNNSSSWAPDLGAKLQINDLTTPYLGANKTIKMVPASIALAGEIKVLGTETDQLDAGKTYTIQASLNNLASEGEVLNPAMEITIPKGFKYVPGSAKVYWNNNSGVALADPTALGILESSSYKTDQTNNFTFDVSKTIQTSGSNFVLPVDVLEKRNVYLEADFIVDCESDLYNVAFKGKISGQTVYGDTGFKGDGRTYSSNTLKATLGNLEKFNISTSLTNSQNNAQNVFTPSQTEATYSVKINWATVVGNLTNEKLLVTLPKGVLSVNGIVVVETDIAGVAATATPLKTPGEAADNFDTWSIDLPSAAINSAANKTADITYTFKLNSSFDGTGSLLADPKQAISASVVTMASLPSCPGNNKPYEISNLAKTDILFFAYTLPTPLATSLGAAYAVSTTTSGVSGTMSIGTDNGTFDSGTSTWTVTPTTAIASGNDNEPRPVTITPIYDGVTFSPVATNITVYPSLIFSLPTTTALCSNGTVSQNLYELISGDVKAIGTSTVMKYYEGTSTTELGSSTVTPTTDTDYYVQSETHDGVLKGEKKKIAVTLNAPAAITGDLSTTPVYKTVNDLSVDLSITATGYDLSYQWYSSALDDSGETPIQGATTDSYSVPTTDVSAKKYYVKVTGCSGVVTSLKAIVHVVAAPAAVTFKETDYTYCDAVSSGLTLWNEINTVSGLTYWYATTSNGTLTEVSATNTVSISSAGSYYVKSKNAAGVYSAEELLQVVVNTSISKPVITISNEELEISAATGSTGAVTINVASVSGTPATGGYTYKLYDSGNNLVSSIQKQETSHTFTVTYGIPSAAFQSYSYYVIVTGSEVCGESPDSNPVSVTVYPAAEIALNSTTTTKYCQDDATALSNIGLYTYIDAPNSYLTYEYKLDNEWKELTSSTVIANNNDPDTYIYTLRAKNANDTYSVTTPEVTIIVQKRTVITKVEGYEVTEGDAINIVVVADGEGDLEYDWYEGSGTTPLETTNVGTYQITPSSNRGVDDNKIYRVVVRGEGECAQAEQSFRLNVKPRSIPPAGNYRVSWDITGYGKVEVKADGISISNGSHVNKGAKLEISATTWKSNVLDWVTVNGTEYKFSPITYTVGEVNVDIVANFLGSDPNPDDPNSNAEIENGNRIWTEGGYAYIHTETATRVRIVTFNGRLITDQKIGEGESRIQLPDGYYIVTLSDGTTKKIAIRNF